MLKTASPPFCLPDASLPSRLREVLGKSLPHSAAGLGWGWRAKAHRTEAAGEQHGAARPPRALSALAPAAPPPGSNKRETPCGSMQPGGCKAIPRLIGRHTGVAPRLCAAWEQAYFAYPDRDAPPPPAGLGGPPAKQGRAPPGQSLPMLSPGRPPQ